MNKVAFDWLSKEDNLIKMGSCLRIMVVLIVDILEGSVQRNSTLECGSCRTPSNVLVLNRLCELKLRELHKGLNVI